MLKLELVDVGPETTAIEVWHVCLRIDEEISIDGVRDIERVAHVGTGRCYDAMIGPGAGEQSLRGCEANGRNLASESRHSIVVVVSVVSFCGHPVPCLKVLAKLKAD